MNTTTKILILLIIILSLVVGYLLIDASSGTKDAATIVYASDIGALNAGGSLDYFCSIWCGRIFAFSSLMLGFAIVYGYYSYKIALIDARVDIAEIECEAAAMLRSKPPETTAKPVEPEEDIRLIPFNTFKSTGRGKDIVLADNLTVPKTKLIEFITKSLKDDGPGLAIGRWKREGWDQELVESLLDYLHSIGIVTPRANGRVCEYTDNYDITEILRKIADER